MTLILRAAAATDLGLVRENNEDAAFAGTRLVAVADGIGGLPAGELASDAVIRALAPLEDDDGGRPARVALRAAVETANDEINETGRVAAQPDGMGTTVTAMLLTMSWDQREPELVLLHIGDSRAYLMRDGELFRLTRDDTFVQELVDQGVLSVEEARVHPLRSVVTRAVSGRPLDPAFSAVVPQVGDRYLVCSDGLSDVVDDVALARTLLDAPDPQRCAGDLVELALTGGGPDNITAVVADVIYGGPDVTADVIYGGPDVTADVISGLARGAGEQEAD